MRILRDMLGITESDFSLSPYAGMTGVGVVLFHPHL